MKKARLLALLAIMALPLTSCGGGNSGNNDPVNPPVDPGDDPTKKTLTSIAITTDPAKKEYSVGEELDLTGMVVTAYYSDESSEVVTDYTHSNPDMSTAGQKEVTISFEGKTVILNIVVSDGPVDPGDPDWSAEMKATLAELWPGLELPYFLNEKLGNVDIVPTVGNPDYRDHFEFFGDADITSDDLADVAAFLAEFGFEDQYADYRTPEAQAQMDPEEVEFLEWYYPMELKYENDLHEARYFEVVLASDKMASSEDEEAPAEGLARRGLSLDGEEPTSEPGDDDPVEPGEDDPVDPVEPGDPVDPVDPVDPAEEEAPKFYAFALDPYDYSWDDAYAGFILAYAFDPSMDMEGLFFDVYMSIVPFPGSATYKSYIDFDDYPDYVENYGYAPYYLDDVSEDDVDLYAATLENLEWQIFEYEVEPSEDPLQLDHYYRAVSPDDFLMVEMYYGAASGQLCLAFSLVPEYTDAQKEIASGFSAAGLSIYDFSVSGDTAYTYEIAAELDYYEAEEEDFDLAEAAADALAEELYNAFDAAEFENIETFVLDEFDNGYGRFLAVDADGNEFLVSILSDYDYEISTTITFYFYAEIDIAPAPEFPEEIVAVADALDVLKYDFNENSDGSYSLLLGYNESVEDSAAIAAAACTVLGADDRFVEAKAFDGNSGKFLFTDSEENEFLVEVYLYYYSYYGLYLVYVDVSDAPEYPAYVEQFAELVGANSKYDFELSSNGYYYFEKDSDEDQFDYALGIANSILEDENLEPVLLDKEIVVPEEFKPVEGDDQWSAEIQEEMFALFGELLPFVALNEETLYGGLDDEWADYGEYSWVIGDDNETNLVEDYGDKLVEAGFELSEDYWGDPCYTKTVASGLDITVYATYYEATDDYDAGNEIYVSFETDELPSGDKPHAYYDIAILDSVRIVIEAGYDADSGSYYYWVALLPYQSQPEHHEYTTTISTALGFEEDAFTWYASDKVYELYDGTGAFAPADEQSEEEYFSGLVATIAAALGEDWSAGEISAKAVFGTGYEQYGMVYSVTFTCGEVEITVQFVTDPYGYVGLGDEYNLIIDIDPFVEAPAEEPEPYTPPVD